MFEVLIIVNRKLKIFLILSGYIIVFILTFIFLGGLEDLLQFLSESAKTLEEIINKIITKLGGLIP